MAKDNERWLKKIKQSLKDYSEPLPASGWERLEQALSASSVSQPHKKEKLRPFSRWWPAAAAAAVLLAMFMAGLWLIPQSGVDEISVPQLAGKEWETSPDAELIIVEPALPVQADRVARVVRKAALREEVQQQQLEKPEEASMTEEKPEEDTSAQTELGKKEAVQTGKAEEKADSSSSSWPSRRRKLQAVAESKSRKGLRGWSFGLAVGNNGGLSSEEGAEEMQMYDASGLVGNTGRFDLSSTADEILKIPAGQDLVFKDGLPYVLETKRQIVSARHKQPVSVGFSVRKRLPKGFSVETGLTYTYLASDIEYADSPEAVSQKLHYIGIPLRANWDFVRTTYFNIYLSAGGAMEKCVYGKIGGEKETVDPLQFSVAGALGAQLNISRKVGVYVEPGVSYYFDDGSDVQTIRKENPFNFTLQGGLRLTY